MDVYCLTVNCAPRFTKHQLLLLADLNAGAFSFAKSGVVVSTAISVFVKNGDAEAQTLNTSQRGQRSQERTCYPRRSLGFKHSTTHFFSKQVS